MQFPCYSAAVLSVLSVALAAPPLPLKSHVVSRELTSRGLIFDPLGLSNLDRGNRDNRDNRGHSNSNSNSAIVIEDETVEQTLTEVQIGSENQLVELIQQQVDVKKEVIVAQNNVRRNHFANVFQDVQTVVTVVTVVVDARDQLNINTRYLCNEILANELIQQEQQKVVMVTELQTMTILALPTQASLQLGNLLGNATATGSAALATGSGSVASDAIAQLMPFGSAPPSSQSIFMDPAAIIEENQSLYIEQISVDGGVLAESVAESQTQTESLSENLGGNFGEKFGGILGGI